MHEKLITIFGGGGFLGSVVVKKLAQKGYRIRVVSRDIEKNRDLKPLGNVGQIALMQGDIKNPESVEQAVNGADIVINLVGLLFEKGKQNFDDAHVGAARNIANSTASDTQIIQMSSLGVDIVHGSKYALTKHEAEKIILASHPDATIIRPSVIFGASDSFTNKFAQMASISPALPLVGCGKTKFQPVHIDDVAEAIVRMVENPEAAGKIYELGGPEIMSFKEILQFILEQTGGSNFLIPLPYAVASMIGAFGSLLPNPPLTMDQVALLKYDNIMSAKQCGFDSLGINPASMRAIAPDYLKEYQKGGYYTAKYGKKA
jgi:uncharacterized protein YbjT (DUF2867 family)